jgi:pimeloyl-ACP methyl ester carboxylesterase
MRTATAILPARKSTNVRFSLVPPLARLAHGLLARLAPGRAERRLRDIMLTPKRPGEPGAADLLRKDNATRVPYGSRWLSVWSFGSGPTVLLAHGWSGHAAQFDAWIEPLVAAGYRAVLFDAPAHGRSGGRQTNIMDMAGAIQHVAGLFGPVHAIAAHSFGAPATLFALRHGLKVDRLALMAAPLSLTLWSVFLAKLLGFPMAVRARLQQRMENRLEFRWDEVETDRQLAELAAERKLDVLLIHDRRDREVPFTSAERIAAAVPAARFYVTDGNGHARLLRSAKVIAEAIGFVGGGPRQARQAA